MTSSKLFTRILVAVDGSRSAEKAARYALGIAAREDCELVVLHVVDEANAGDLARYADLPMEIILERMRQNGEKYIEVIRNMSTDGEVTIVGRICVGIPHRAILSTSREEKIDLIVLGTVGRKGARRVLIGSVTERVIEYAHVPVLVVK